MTLQMLEKQLYAIENQLKIAKKNQAANPSDKKLKPKVFALIGKKRQIESQIKLANKFNYLAK